ncbi:hypothetical protein FDUTEX481_07460 [Tolypothrix sp. PCC 7601]|nr:hypothetical protein FDUTEX481_07460 [Tolypothrix sp. PCC 7601]
MVFVICHLLFVICYLSFVICHWVIGNWYSPLVPLSPSSPTP